VKGFEIGAADYVTKPFREPELLARVNTHIELKKHRDYLENLVQERTQAIKVMMQIREEVSAGVEEKITARILHRVLPMVEVLKETLTKANQKECLSIIESGLSEILSDFSQKLSSPSFSLTPAEIQVAELIRDGKSGREIANLLGVGENTVIFHRSNIRKKLGLTHLKTNLRIFLQAMES
jgi:DNA-binding NarL/FixJ family response regulator